MGIQSLWLPGDGGFCEREESRVNPLSRSTQWLVWGGLALLIVAVTVLYLTRGVPPSGTPTAYTLPVIAQLDPFRLLNQEGRSVTLDSLRGKVWVADVIFTRCAGPCLQMTQRMKELETAVGAQSPVEFVSFTTDPEFDTPEVLKTYARRLGADSARWQFITGPKPELVRVMIDGLKFTALEKKPEDRTDPSDLFIHSTIFIVVDKLGRVRKAVEGLEPDFKSKILAVVNQLAKE